MGCHPLVLQSLSELLMLKAHVICSGKGFKSNLEHPESSSPAVQVQHAHSHDVGRLCHFPFFLLLTSPPLCSLSPLIREPVHRHAAATGIVSRSFLKTKQVFWKTIHAHLLKARAQPSVHGVCACLLHNAVANAPFRRFKRMGKFCVALIARVNFHSRGFGRYTVDELSRACARCAHMTAAACLVQTLHAF